MLFGRVEELHNGVGMSMARLLGAVMAHELGHLLLGSHAHSPIGIMMPTWEDQSLGRIGMGTFLFTSEQASVRKARLGREGTGLIRAGIGGKVGWLNTLTAKDAKDPRGAKPRAREKTCQDYDDMLRSYRLRDHQRRLDAWLDAVDVKDNLILVVHDSGSVLGFSWAQRRAKQVKAAGLYGSHRPPVFVVGGMARRYPSVLPVSKYSRRRGVSSSKKTFISSTSATSSYSLGGAFAYAYSQFGKFANSDATPPSLYKQITELLRSHKEPDLKRVESGVRLR